jgi:phosphoribosylanthranilate isomerase
MTWIKICGITNLGDALTAVEAGADALGFVFYKKSVRNVIANAAASIIEKLPETLEKVGVVVEDFTQDLNLPANLTAVQWTHATIPKNMPMFIESSVPRRYKTFMSLPAANLDENLVKQLTVAFERSAKHAGKPNLIPAFDALFLDSGNAHNPGGTGKPFHWETAVSIADQMRGGPFKLVIAGGLTPENVSEAMQVLHPWGVDVSSGVESKPGKKDPEKIRAFVKAVREADKANSKN